MTVKVFIRGDQYLAGSAAVKEILKEVDEGHYDGVLNDKGVSRSSDISLLDNAKFSSGQGVTAGEFAEIIVDFAPVVAEVARDVWRYVVVPRLKRDINEDDVSENDPSDER